jgi:hypothetical protein
VVWIIGLLRLNPSPASAFRVVAGSVSPEIYQARNT